MVPTSFPLVGPAGTGGSVSAHRSTLGAVDLVPPGCGPLLVHAVTATVTQTSKDVRRVVRLSLPFSQKCVSVDLIEREWRAFGNARTPGRVEMVKRLGRCVH